MIRRDGEYRVDIRERMRDGQGKVKIEHLWEIGSELKAKNRLCARLTLEPGCGIGFHSHDEEEEVFYIVSGSAEADDNGTPVKLGPGDTILTGNGGGHAIRCVGSQPLVILAVITCY
jgi:mannose-6-phosphate isomerase-like protein (cupin superfamily)